MSAMVHADGVWLDTAVPARSCFANQLAGELWYQKNQKQMGKACKQLVDRGGVTWHLFNFIKSPQPWVATNSSQCAEDLEFLAFSPKHGGNLSRPTVYMATDYGEFAVPWAASDAESVIAVFLLARGMHWFLGVPPFMEPGLAKVPAELQLDWGAPIDQVMVRSSATSFHRRWAGGVASFDCVARRGKLAPSAHSVPGKLRL